jgi:hypothetical protein
MQVSRPPICHKVAKELTSPLREKWEEMAHSETEPAIPAEKSGKSRRVECNIARHPFHRWAVLLQCLALELFLLNTPIDFRRAFEETCGSRLRMTCARAWIGFA